MPRRRKLTASEIDWLRVEKLRRDSFHGSHMSDEDMEYCRQAYNADGARYAQIGERVRVEYRDNFRWKQ